MALGHLQFRLYRIESQDCDGNHAEKTVGRKEKSLNRPSTYLQRLAQPLTTGLYSRHQSFRGNPYKDPKHGTKEGAGSPNLSNPNRTPLP